MMKTMKSEMLEDSDYEKHNVFMLCKSIHIASNQNNGPKGLLDLQTSLQDAVEYLRARLDPSMGRISDEEPEIEFFDYRRG